VTAAATPHPEAITAETARQVREALVLSGHQGPVWSVALSPDGVQVASGSADHDVRVWDAHTGESLHVLERHRGWVYAVGYTPDGSRLVSGGRDRTVQVWHSASGEHLFGLRAFGEVFGVAFSPDGGYMAAASLYSARGQVWPLEPGAAWMPLEGHTTRLRSVAYSPEGSALATGDEAGTILLHEADTGAVVAELDGGSEDVYGLAFSPDGRRLVAGSGDGTIRVFDVASGEEQQSWLAHAGGVWDLALSPDGAVLASGGQDSWLALWAMTGDDTVETGARLATVGSHGSPVRTVDFSRDGTTLASGGDDGRVRLWRLATEMSSTTPTDTGSP
jgi:WD40 repeat protein